MNSRGYSKAFEGEIKGAVYDMYFDSDSVESHILYFDRDSICQEMAIVGALENIGEVVSEFGSDTEMFLLSPMRYQHLPSHTLWTIECDDKEHIYFVRVNYILTQTR